MALKDILVYVDKDNELTQKAAIKLAAAYDAHLIGLYVAPKMEFPKYSEVRIPEETLQPRFEESEAAAEELRKKFFAAAGQADCSADWQLIFGHGDQEVTDAARYVDLVIVNQTDENTLAGIPFIKNDQLVMSCARPVLFIPYIGAPESMGERILVAWDGSRESVRAVNDALVLIENSKQVDIVTINAADDDKSASAMSQHLQRHGVEARVRRIVSKEVDAADELLSVAADMGSDLIVMGAYGHTRIRELILGGVTRKLLKNMTIPVLMTH